MRLIKVIGCITSVTVVILILSSTSLAEQSAKQQSNKENIDSNTPQSTNEQRDGKVSPDPIVGGSNGNLVLGFAQFPVQSGLDGLNDFNNPIFHFKKLVRLLVDYLYKYLLKKYYLIV